MRYLALLTVFALTAVPLAMAEEKKKPARQVVSISFDTPATNYSVQITGVYKVGEEIWAVSKVHGGGGIGGAAITRVSDAVTIEPTELPVKHKVLGKSWNWGKDTDTIEYVPAKKEKELKAKLADAKKVAFERPEKKRK